MNYEFEWEAVGDGWCGRWTQQDPADWGAMGDLVIELEGGLHGGWRWSNPYCSGTCSDPDEAQRRCEQTFEVCADGSDTPTSEDED